MKKENNYQKIKKYAVLILILFCSVVFGQEGTKQVSPSSSQLSGLYWSYNSNYGSYYNAPDDNRIKFDIADYTTERFYFGFSWTQYSSSTAQTLGGAVGSMYYRILNSSGTVVAGPTLLSSTTNGRITSYTQAVSGPTVVGGVSGYTPITFTPTANGSYYIEYWAGTPTSNSTNTTSYISPFFDFTVATTSGISKPGRVYATQWGLAATRNTSGSSYVTDISATGSPSFYAYTDSENVVKITLPSIAPLAYTIAINNYGVSDTNDFSTDRRSVNNMGGSTSSTTSTAPSLPGGYLVFLNSPDEALFSYGTVTSAPPYFNMPAVTPVNTCNIAPYNINVHAGSSGDYQIKISASGYTDRILELLNMTVGDYNIVWDGKDGAGTTIPASTNVTLTIIAFSDRFNIPLYDVERNSGGIYVQTISPSAYNTSNLFWDDSQLSAYGTCSTSNQAANNTGAGSNNSLIGTPMSGSPYPHNWTNATDLLCDDFGNSRTINTWGYTYYETASTSTSLLCADLTITKTVSNPTPNVGDNVTFTITAINSSSGSTAGNVVVNDVLPAGFTLVSATPSSGTWSAPNWNVGTLINGANKTLTIVAKVNPETHYTNIASVSTANYETNYNNNTAYAKVTPNVMPELTATNICPTPDIDVVPPKGVELNDLHIGTVPAGSTLVWYNNPTHSGSAITNTFITTTGSYYAYYYDSANNCYSPASAKVNILIQDCKCRKSPVTGTPNGYTKVGISTQANKVSNWPENVANGFIAMESTNKGFVITRTTSASITTPIRGMLIYDTGDNCFKVYNGTTWHCLTQTCNE